MVWGRINLLELIVLVDWNDIKTELVFKNLILKPIGIFIYLSNFIRYPENCDALLRPAQSSDLKLQNCACQTF